MSFGHRETGSISGQPLARWRAPHRWTHRAGGSFIAQVQQEERSRVSHVGYRISIELFLQEHAISSLFETISHDRLGKGGHRILRKVQQVEPVSRSGEAGSTPTHAQGGRRMDARDDPYIVGDEDTDLLRYAIADAERDIEQMQTSDDIGKHVGEVSETLEELHVVARGN